MLPLPRSRSLRSRPTDSLRPPSHENQDLASFIVDCVSEEGKINKMLPIGGPGKAYTPKEQADLLFGLMGEKPKYFPVPVSLMDGIIGIFEFFSRWFPSLEDTAEFGKIGKYVKM